MTKDELTVEQLEQMAIKTIELKSEILECLSGAETRIGLSALVAAASDVIAQTAPSKDEALGAIATFATSLAHLIDCLDEEGECVWNNYPSQTRQ